MRRALIYGVATLAVLATSSPATGAECRWQDLRGTWLLYMAGSLHRHGDPWLHALIDQCEVFPDGKGGLRAGSGCGSLGNRPIETSDFALRRDCRLRGAARLSWTTTVIGLEASIVEAVLSCRVSGAITRDRDAVHGVLSCPQEEGLMGSEGSFSMVRR